MGQRNVGFFRISVCGLGMERFDNNPSSSMVQWRADWTVGGRELVFVNMYAPPKLKFLYCIVVSRF